MIYLRGRFTEGLRCLNCISLRLIVPNNLAAGVWISSGQPELQCVHSATRGRSALMSPATSLCVWTWRKSLLSPLLQHLTYCTSSLCLFVCESVKWCQKQKKKKNQKDEQKPVEGGGVTKKTDSDRLAASCWRTVTVEGLFCWDPSSPSRPRVCRSPPGSSSPRHGPEHHNHTPHQRQLQLTLFLLKVYSPLTSGIFLLIWCIFIKSDASM